MTRIQQIEQERTDYEERKARIRMKQEQLQAERLAVREKMWQLRNVEKLSYKAIGQRFGISRQRVHQILSGYRK